MTVNLNLIKAAIEYAIDSGADTFIENNSGFSHSNIDGVYHYTSIHPLFEKFIYFNLGNTKALSLVFKTEKLTLADINSVFHIENAHYDFRDDTSKAQLKGKSFLFTEGKLDIYSSPMKSIDAKGNVLCESEILVASIVIEFN